MLCSKIHCQKYLNSIPFSNKMGQMVNSRVGGAPVRVSSWQTRKNPEATTPYPTCHQPSRFHLQRLTIHKRGCNQNYYLFTLIFLIKIVLCSQLHRTKLIICKCFHMRLVCQEGTRSSSEPEATTPYPTCHATSQA